MSIQTYEMAGFLYWWIMNVSGTLGFFNVSYFLVEACRKVETASAVLSYSIIQQSRGNPTKASGMLMI